MDWKDFENEDGTINTNHTVFQQGRNLYDTQCLLADLEAGKELDRELVKKVLEETCSLINAVGQLRADYSSRCEKQKGMVGRLMDVLRGK